MPAASKGPPDSRSAHQGNKHFESLVDARGIGEGEGEGEVRGRRPQVSAT